MLSAAALRPWALCSAVVLHACLAPIHTSAANPYNFISAAKLGSTAHTYGSGIAVDPQRNTYASGWFTGTLALPGTNLVSRGGEDVFIAKFDPQGNLLWAKQAGGTNDDRALAVAVDSQGNSFLAGTFRSPAQFEDTVASGPYYMTAVFTAKYDPSGHLLWVRHAGSAGYTLLTSLATDTTGQPCIAGSVSVPTTFGTNVLDRGLFAAKYTTQGDVLWATRIGADYWDQTAGIAVDTTGQHYVAGSFNGTKTFGTTALTSQGDFDIFVAKLDSSGNLVWVSQAGGTNYQAATGIALDTSANFHITGTLYPGTATFGDTTLTNAGIFIAKGDTAGNFLWARGAGGSTLTTSHGIAVDGNGNCYIAGTYDSHATTGVYFGDIMLSGAGAFLAQYDTSGAFRWVTPAPCTNTATAKAVATSPLSTAHVVGYFRGSLSLGPLVLTNASIGNALFVGNFGAPPVIFTNPQSQTILQGQSATLSVAASGPPPLQYQWLSNGSNLPSATCPSYAITNAQSADAAIYLAIVTAANLATATSAPATITVVVPPTITSDPIDTTVLRGATLSLTVGTSGSQPLAFQWRKEGANLQTLTAATLLISDAQPTHAGAYNAVVTNAAGAVTSHVATVTVLIPPAITSQPSDITANQGATAQIAVQATGSPPLAYQWRKDTAPIPTATNSILQLPNIQSADAGRYTCVVTNAGGTATSTGATVTVIFPPLITVQPVDQTVPEGATVILTVQADGTPPLDYTWYKGSLQISASGAPALFITNAQVADSAGYTVMVTNPAGAATSRTATLTVTNVPPTFSVHPTNQTVLEGFAATLTAQATGTRPLSYVWRKAGVPISGASATAYTIQSAQPTDAGNYDVVATNIAGAAASAVATLTVTGIPPTILLHPSNTTAMADTTAQFSALTTGVPPPALQWVFKGSNIIGKTNALLLLTEITTNDSGIYKMRAQNAYGDATSAGATLSVTGPALTLAVALDAPGYLWRTGGEQPWIPQTNTTHDGVAAAASGSITDNQQSWLATTVNGPGQISFWSKSSSEDGFDGLSFSVDGAQQRWVSGEVPWTAQTINIPPGTHDLRWAYLKDGSDSAGQDKSWLDQVTFTPSPGAVQPIYLTQPKVRLRDGLFQMDLVSEAGKLYTVERSTNFADWASVLTLTNLTGTARVIDPNSKVPASMFYRATLLNQ